MVNGGHTSITEVGGESTLTNFIRSLEVWRKKINPKSKTQRKSKLPNSNFPSFGFCFLVFLGRVRILILI